MIVYRIQCSVTGKGMYSWKGHGPYIDNCYDINPGTVRDFGVKQYDALVKKYSGYENMRHGFNSIQMLWNWFHRNSDNLRQTVRKNQYEAHAKDYPELIIARYYVPMKHVDIASCQVVFNEKYARRLADISVEDVIVMAITHTEEPEEDMVAVTIPVYQYDRPPAFPKGKEWMKFNRAPKSVRKYG